MNDLVVTAHDGIELAVRDHGGEGPDVLLLHGAQRSLEDWAPVLSHLPGVRAVAMDLRFHGRSEVPPATAWNDFVTDVESVVTSVGLKNPLLVGHSFGGAIAMADAAAHPERAGVVNVDGFDFRQRDLFGEVEPAEVDRFLEEFERQRANFMPPDAGDDAWLEQQRQMMQQLDSTWKVPDHVAAATLERIFVRDGGGWKRRPPNTFFDILDTPDPAIGQHEGVRSYHPSDPSADVLHLLREATVPTVFVLCRPPGEAGMFAKARSGLERHIRTIASSNANVRLETVDATHGVIFEQPARVAEVVRSLL
jgi:pimeloyl-ACP methyl ester carboxylesterase